MSELEEIAAAAMRKRDRTAELPAVLKAPYRAWGAA